MIRYDCGYCHSVIHNDSFLNNYYLERKKKKQCAHMNALPTVAGGKGTHVVHDWKQPLDSR